MEADKIAKRREQLLSQVELPPLDAILRYPIEVWVSSGKNFVAPEGVYDWWHVMNQMDTWLLSYS